MVAYLGGGGENSFLLRDCGFDLRRGDIDGLNDTLEIDEWRRCWVSVWCRAWTCSIIGSRRTLSPGMNAPSTKKESGDTDDFGDSEMEGKGSVGLALTELGGEGDMVTRCYCLTVEVVEPRRATADSAPGINMCC
jgi:hypothetical protein